MALEGLMKGKHVLVVGVANKASIAWGITEKLVQAGAEVALTYQNERLAERVRELAATVNPPLPCLEMDATVPESVNAVFADLDKRWGKLDALVHSIAYAPKEDLLAGIIKTPLESWNIALHVSAYTLLELLRGARPLMEKAGGGSCVTLSYDTTRVYPNYNLMGIAKATLEQTMRYAAWDGGRTNIRVNAISAGPVKTLAARGITGFTRMFEEAGRRAPLGRNITIEEVGNAALFLLSDMGSGITGQTLYVDCGQVIAGAAGADAPAGA